MDDQLDRAALECQCAPWPGIAPIPTLNAAIFILDVVKTAAGRSMWEPHVPRILWRLPALPDT